MADWKMVDADQLDADIKAVADAIRERTGTTEPMAFPDGMVNAVEGITDYLALRATETLVEYESLAQGRLGNYSFCECGSLKRLSLPYIDNTGYNSIANCRNLEYVNLQRCTFVGDGSLRNSEKLLFVDLPEVTKIDWSVFENGGITTLILRKTDTICTLIATSALGGTPIANGNGYIYVPRALVDGYKSATNWSAYASQFRAIEDYPEICGGVSA